MITFVGVVKVFKEVLQDGSFALEVPTGFHDTLLQQLYLGAFLERCVRTHIQTE